MKSFTEKLESILEFGGTKKDILFLIFGGISLLLSLANINILPFDMAWIAIILCGVPIILEAIIGLITEFDIKADVLVSLALIASVLIGEDFAAGEVAFIMQLGALLEDLTVAKARSGIEKLVKLTPQTARVIYNNDNIEIIPAQTVKVGQRLRVLAGETIPVDGIIISGQTSINEAVMTGESLPVDKTVGDEVSSGTVNQFGTFEMEATKVGEDSSIQRMIRLVESADAGKAKIVGMADRWATWIVVIALTAAALTGFITKEIIRAVTILVVFCPCALVLATPTAIMAAIGNATKHGFLVREGDALERLSTVSSVAFDKTGTLTYGKPEVIDVKTTGNYTQEQIFSFAAAAEALSEHPIGKAIVKSYKQKNNNNIKSASDFSLIIGKGITATVENKKIIAGNQKLLSENNIKMPNNINNQADFHLNNGCTVIYIAIDNKLAGFIVLSDTIREQSIDMLNKLKQTNVNPVLLTGDNINSAKNIANKLKINEFISNCLPEDKLKYIKDYQKTGKKICMIGDGINDAPALKIADVGIAMGGIGSDIAVDAADIALVDDEIKELPHLLKLSKKMMNTIKLNLVFSMGLNFLAIYLAITGNINPVIGALVHNAGSVAVIINSALLLKAK